MHSKILSTLAPFVGALALVAAGDDFSCSVPVPPMEPAVEQTIMMDADEPVDEPKEEICESSLPSSRVVECITVVELSNEVVCIRRWYQVQ